MIEPYRVEVSPKTIKDLRDRLRATRWPSGVSDEGCVPLTSTREYDVVHWTEMPHGGHFAALEAPEHFAADVIEFVDGVA